LKAKVSEPKSGENLQPISTSNFGGIEATDLHTILFKELNCCILLLIKLKLLSVTQLTVMTDTLKKQSVSSLHIFFKTLIITFC